MCTCYPFAHFPLIKMSLSLSLHYSYQIISLMHLLWMVPSHLILSTSINYVGCNVALHFPFPGVRQVVEGDLPKVTPDVAVTIARNDLMAIFEGTLAPLQAYLSGHLTVQGNVQMLMGLESLRQGSKDKDKDDVFVV